MVMWGHFGRSTFEISKPNIMKKLLISLALLSFVATTAHAQLAIENKIEVRLICGGDEDALTWINKREVNISYYVVEFASNNNDFQILQTTRARGNTNFCTMYSLPLEFIQQEMAGYFRVTTVEMGGARHVSQAIYFDPIVSSKDTNVIAVR
jgi:hypothetical protein